jgi:hypothetical protein
MVDSSDSICDCDDLPQSNTNRSTFSSYDSCTSDEGYYTDEKPLDDEQQQQQQKQKEDEIPIFKSTHEM